MRSIFAPLAAIRPAMAATAAGRERAAQHGDVEPAAPPGLLPGAHRDLRFQIQVGSQPADRPVDRGQVRVAAAAEQGAEHQPPPDHHLLDVQYGQLLAGQRGEQPGGHPGPVPAGQGDQEGGLLRPSLLNATGAESQARTGGLAARHDVSSV